MNTKKKKIEAILNGTTSPVVTHRYLEELTEEDIEQYLPEEELKKVMAEYRRTNHFICEAVVGVSEAEKDELWHRIKAVGLEKKDKEKRSGTLKNAFLNFFSADTLVVRRFVPVMILLIIVMVIPADFYRLESPEKQLYSGIKGEKELYGSVQYALLRGNETLERPERKLTEADTLAFRINVNQNGYFSLFFVHNNMIDTIFLDQLFEKGVHDLETIYQLKGNYGKNSMVLLSGKIPIGTVVNTNELILNAERNGVPFITVNDNMFSLVVESMSVGKLE